MFVLILPVIHIENSSIADEVGCSEDSSKLFSEELCLSTDTVERSVSDYEPCYEYYPTIHDNQQLVIPGEILIKFKTRPDGTSVDEKQVFAIVEEAVQSDCSFSLIVTKESVFSSYRSQRNKEKTNLHGLNQWYLFTFSESRSVYDEIENYKNNPVLNGLIEEIQPNYIFTTFEIPNDPYYHSSGSWGQEYPDLWGLHKMQMEGAWNITTGNPDVVVAVIDTGVDYNHPDLKDNIWVNPGEDLNGNGIVDASDFNGIDDDNNGFVDDIRGWDFVNTQSMVPSGEDGTIPDNDPIDGQGHGTHCAGTIAAMTNNNLGIAGICWQCKIMPVRAGYKAIDNNGHLELLDAAQAIIYAADNGAQVLSNSWGTNLILSIPLIEDAIQYAYTQGCHIVFAAGNNNVDVQYCCPANMKEIIAVAATDYFDTKADFSNWGMLIDVSAPGGNSGESPSSRNILSLRGNNTDIYNDESCIVDSNYYRSRGTSMACPHVAGLIALMLSKNQSMTQEMIRTILINAVDPVNSSVPVGGRINASDALYREPALVSWDIADPNDIKGIFPLYGAAWGVRFQYYTVEYGKGRIPDSWTMLINASCAVQQGFLGQLDTMNLAEGSYSLRLTLVCEDGVYTDLQIITVNNQINTYSVDIISGQADFIKIQDAIDTAGQGDTVYVYAGLYNENLIIDRSIFLIGEDKDTAIIDGSNKDSVVFILSPFVDIHGFTIINSGIKTLDCGIIVRASNCSIHNCIIKNSKLGIVLLKANQIRVSNNSITVPKGAQYKGCYLVGSTFCTIEHNQISVCDESQPGINIEASSNNYIQNNSITGTGAYYHYGLFVNWFSTSNKIIDNHCQNMFYGIAFALYATHNVVFQNTITQTNRGIEIIIDSNSNHFSKNLIALCTEYGVKTYNIPRIGSINNTFYHNSFILNKVSAEDPCENIWNNETLHQGNYWSDYTNRYPLAVDANNDGVWDTPYVLTGGSRDRYPLTESIRLYASAQGPYKGFMNQLVLFSGFALGGTQPYEWFWEFNDGTYLNEQNCVRSFNVSGEHLVRLVVSDLFGNSYTDTSTVTIASIYNVNQDMYYPTIQEAINVSASNDTILIGQGEYKENLIINKPLSLYGENYSSTILNSASNGTTILIDHTHHVVIQGFSIKNDYGKAGDRAIILQYSDYCQISNNYITNKNGAGICADYSSNNIFYHNMFINNTAGGIQISGMSNIIQENHFINTTAFYGICLKGNSNYISKYSLVRKNTLINNQYTVLFRYSTHNTFMENQIIDNPYVGINLESTSSYNRIIGNNVHSNDYTGMYIADSSYNTIIENNISHNGVAGLVCMPNSRSNTIYHNIFLDNFVNAKDHGNNYWYNETTFQGNYWSDFNELSGGAWDNNSDGILDSPYIKIIGTSSKDWYPLRFPFVRGDMNVDGRVSADDINPFVLALIQPTQYQNMYHFLSSLHGDINQDGVLDFADINPFITILMN